MLHNRKFRAYIYMWYILKVILTTDYNTVQIE